MDFIFGVLGLVIGWYVGQMYLLNQLTNEIVEFNKNKEKNFLASINGLMEIEKMYTVFEENNLFLYNEKNFFICQAKTLEELAKNLVEFKKIRAALVKHEEDFYLFVDGQIKKMQ